MRSTLSLWCMKCTPACVGDMCILCYVFSIPCWCYIAHYPCVCGQGEEDVDEPTRLCLAEWNTHRQVDSSVLCGARSL